jgi:putative transposase
MHAGSKDALGGRHRNRKLSPLVHRAYKELMTSGRGWLSVRSDGLIGGRRLRCLTVVDDCTRECLAIEVDRSIPGLRVQAVLDRLADTRGLPKSITVDNGPEFDG